MKTRKMLVGAVLGVLAPAAAPVAGQSAEMRAVVKRINEADSRAEIADMMIADTARTSLFRSQAARGMAYFVATNTGAAADSALDALIRAYEGIEAYNAANPPNKRLGGMRLRYIFRALTPRGAAYVREVFATAEPPPFCDSGEALIRIPNPKVPYCERDPTETPYCEAGGLLHGPEVLGNESRYGRAVDSWLRPETPPEIHGLSEPAAKWWSRCWDRGFSG